MDLTQLANIGEFVGGVAVLVTLAYLAVQVGGSKKALLTQTHHNFLATGSRPLEMLASDHELAEIVHRGDADPDGLSGQEWERYAAFSLILLNAWEYCFYLSQSRSVPHGFWEGVDSWFVSRVRSRRGCEKFWREHGHAYGEPFHSYAASRFSGAAGTGPSGIGMRSERWARSPVWSRSS